MTTHQQQAESYSAGYNLGRNPTDPNFKLSAKDFPTDCADDFEEGFVNGVSDAETE